MTSKQEVCPTCWPRMKVLIDRRKVQADEIERLTAELQGTKDELYSVDKAAKELGAERDHLKATVEELRTVSAGLRKYGTRCAAYGREILGLRAALEEIVQHESFDNDGEPMPETGAAFIAKRALAGAADSERQQCIDQAADSERQQCIDQAADETTATLGGIQQMLDIKKMADKL